MATLTPLVAFERRDIALAHVRRIFFESSVTGNALEGTERDLFFHDWAGRYIDRWPDWVYLANENDVPVGYLIGCPDTAANLSALQGLFYLQAFSPCYQTYPAHFHVNCDTEHRGIGIGAQLVERYCSDLGAAGIGGVHLVTASKARNRKFYARLGFHEHAQADVNGRQLVLLGRRLER